MIRDIGDFRRRKTHAALMFAERALDDAAKSYTVEPDEQVASAIGHLRVAVADLQVAADRIGDEAA